MCSDIFSSTFFLEDLRLRQGMATFSSKIAPSLYILIFKEHIRLIYNDLKIKRENSQVHSLLQVTNYKINARVVWSGNTTNS